MIDLKSLGFPERGFLPFGAIPFFNSKKECFGGFSFDNHSVNEELTAADHSANDELQLQITTGDHSSLADRSSRWEVLLRMQKVKKIAEIIQQVTSRSGSSSEE